MIRAINMTADRVRALQNGATQIRVPVKRQDQISTGFTSECFRILGHICLDADCYDCGRSQQRHYESLFSPFGVPGDRLVVKEAYRFSDPFDLSKPSKVSAKVDIKYEADNSEYENGYKKLALSCGYILWGRYRHARSMPYKFSRYTLELTDVRVERVQDTWAWILEHKAVE